jgi:hypothetical protein
VGFDPDEDAQSSHRGFGLTARDIRQADLDE